MDPFSAFAVAGNVLQFAELGVKLIVETVKYAHEGGGAQHQAIAEVTQCLVSSTAQLQTILEAEPSRLIQPGPIRALFRANQKCLTVSQELVALLNSLRLRESGSAWKTIKLTLRSLASSGKIAKLKTKVEDTRSNLMLSFMVYTVATQFAASQGTLQADLVRKVEFATRSSTSLRQSVDALVGKFESLSFDVTGSLKSLSPQASSALSDFTERMDSALQSTNEEFELAAQLLKGVLKSMNDELCAQLRILDSLRFPQMNDRRHRVERAHSGTYQWIFRYNETRNMVKDDFMTWLDAEDNEGIYWVRGKPGSGKSTLMRELDIAFSGSEGNERVVPDDDNCVKPLSSESEGPSDQIDTSDSTGKHAATDMLPTLHLDPSNSREKTRLIKASCFFWYAGTANQKSHCGMLHTLLHQLFSQRKDLILPSLSKETHERVVLSTQPVLVWDSVELESLLQSFIQKCDEQSKILLIIDGLDEFDGTDHDRVHMVRFLKSLTLKRHVKACLSSRPWNVYIDAFSSCPKLRLEYLTKDDIKNCVIDTLYHDKLFQQHRRQAPELLDRIPDEITSMADGVFLWVRLVLRDLLKLVRDGCSPQQLVRKLRNTPRDLDKYFMDMMESIDPDYRRDASLIMQTLICDLDVVTEDVENHAETLKSAPKFLLVHLSYLDEDTGPNFAARADFRPLNYNGGISVFDIENLERRLSSRSMGLIEAVVPLWETDLWRAGIGFLHRTVKDFLCTSTTQRVLIDFTEGPFDALRFRYNVLVAHIWSVANAHPRLAGVSHHAGYLETLLCCLFTHIQHNPDKEVIDFSLFENMTGALGHYFSSPASAVLFPFRSHTAPTRLATFLEGYWTKYLLLTATLAIDLGWHAYIEAKVTESVVRAHNTVPLLSYAMWTPPNSPTRIPDVQIIHHLLKSGADPNQAVMLRSSVGLEADILSSTPGEASIWLLFGVGALGIWDRNVWFSILRLMIRYGADEYIQRNQEMYARSILSSSDFRDCIAFVANTNECATPIMLPKLGGSHVGTSSFPDNDSFCSVVSGEIASDEKQDTRGFPTTLDNPIDAIVRSLDVKTSDGEPLWKFLRSELSAVKKKPLTGYQNRKRSLGDAEVNNDFKENSGAKAHDHEDTCSQAMKRPRVTGDRISSPPSDASNLLGDDYHPQNYGSIASERTRS